MSPFTKDTCHNHWAMSTSDGNWDTLHWCQLHSARKKWFLQDNYKLHLGTKRDFIFSCSQHSHSETLCLITFAVWLPALYLLNSFRTDLQWFIKCREGWEMEWDSMSQAQIFQSAITLHRQPPLTLTSLVTANQYGSCGTYWQWYLRSKSTERAPVE